ncbi:MAG TPA: Vms1/Ankzf1 family peptidyl-tRNA hydrolase [Mycobacteriales bacterium]|nr:Vms1/Ankzf1 family peptidyl-tRNA hydrolase [Mycobacteriales bacterium]
MDLHDLSTVLNADGPFVTIHVESESAVEQAQDKYELEWKDILAQLSDQGVDERTREAIAAAKGTHAQGASRLVVATPADGTVRLAVSLASPPRRPLVDIAALPHLLPLVDDVTTQVPHVVVVADRTGADVSAYGDSSDSPAEQATVKGSAPDIRKVPVGGWSQLRYQHRAENGWHANAKQIVDTVVDLAQKVGAEVIVAVGDEREVTLVREHLPTHLQDRVLVVAGGRGADGSEALVRRRVADALSLHVVQKSLDLLDGYAQERGQGKRAADGVQDVVEALRKAQVETLLLTTDAAAYSTLLFGPEPAQIGTTADELAALGVDDPKEGPMIDVLIRAALGTGAQVQLVPHELATAPRGGVGAVLRYADSLGADSLGTATAQQ